MNLREATIDDVSVIRSVAKRSLVESYGHFLDDETIDEAVEHWYDSATLVESVERENHHVLLATVDDEPVGFAEAAVIGDGRRIGQILWLHVDPDHRGSGYGARLLAQMRRRLLDTGAEEIRGLVLAQNDAGNEFYRRHGFERAHTRSVEIGDRSYEENVYVESDGDSDAIHRSTELIERDGRTMYVDYGDVERGSMAPFFATYRDESRADRLGLFCGHCEGTNTAMDPMGRIECIDCGNRRQPTRWDASYL